MNYLLLAALTILLPGWLACIAWMVATQRRTRGEQPPPPDLTPLERLMERRRVVVSATDRVSGWKGVVHDVLPDETLVLSAASKLYRRDGDGSTAEEPIPGMVVIPQSRILVVQIETD